LAATGNEFVVLVRRGKARFAVTPGGPRRWLIETRSARVEVVGTVLSVESSEGFVAVKVDEGAVLVRSPLLRDGVQRVQAGQTLRLETKPEPAHVPPPAPAAAEPMPELSLDELPEAPAAELVRKAPRLRPRERAALKQRAAAPREAGMNAAELWAGADEARQSGDAARAAKLLERLLYEHPGDSQAALGAYTLARLQLEKLARPRAAADRFAQALDLGLAAPLRESCYVRWVEALRQAGQGATLRGVAAEYLKQYPKGSQRQAMQRLIDAPVAGTP
jgi:transmembrane sensor